MSSIPQIQRELILDLMGHLLDPKTLGTASCVAKSWHSILSSDRLWLPLCLSHHPSITTTSSSSSYNIPPRHLFSLVQNSSSCRKRIPCIPRISLNNLIFSIDIFNHDNNPVLSMVRFGEELTIDECKWNNHRVFRFDMEVKGKEFEFERARELRGVWNVVTKGWGGAFLMMDRVIGKEKRVVMTNAEEIWFSEELPKPACCSSMVVGGAGLVAELVVGLRLCGDDGGRRVERVELGLMRGLEWRYLSVDDALLYLQPFLLN